MSALFLHIDANKFYAACERIFRPDLREKPVVVLSNNDGCVVALTNEAKALGIRRGVPLFQVRDLVKRHGVAVFSSNYELYQSISDRIALIVGRFVPTVERYSIDELFGDLSELTGNLTDTVRELRATILRWTGIPCCAGIGPTKTLAKLCDHFAKTYPVFGGVVNWTELSPERRARALALTPVSDVWGVGPRTAAKLEALGVRTAADFLRMPAADVRRRFGVVLERTHRELAGLSCLPLEPTPNVRQRICRSRSFGTPSRSLDDILSALTAHVSEAARLLRREGLKTASVRVFFHSDPFREDLPQHAADAEAHLSEPTDDTFRMLAEALRLAQRHYRPNVAYKKAGVILADLTDRRAAALDADLFADRAAEAERERREALTRTLDALERRFGKGAVAPATLRLSDAWKMKSDRLSPAFTTRWEDLPEVW